MVKRDERTSKVSRRIQVAQCLLTNAAGEAATRRPRRFRLHRPPRDRVEARRVRHAPRRALRATAGRREVPALPDAGLLGDLEESEAATCNALGRVLARTPQGDSCASGFVLVR